MPRMGRVVLPNYPHHVVHRGHNRQVVFAAEQDYQRYIADLRGIYGVRVIDFGEVNVFPILRNTGTDLFLPAGE